MQEEIILDGTFLMIPITFQEWADINDWCDEHGLDAIPYLKSLIMDEVSR